jgi:hypothetical protein
MSIQTPHHTGSVFGTDPVYHAHRAEPRAKAHTHERTRMATATSLIPVDAGMTGDYLPPVDPKAVEQAMLIGDLSKMSNEQRIAYYVATCRSLGLNPLTKPFQAMQGDDGKLSLYADKGCAEQLRKLHKVSMKVLGREILDGLYIVTVLAHTPDGREEEAQGIVPLVKAKGRWEDYEYKGQARRRFKPDIGTDGQEVMVPLSHAERANAMKRAETQAKRRATLAICGLGIPDWEADPASSAHPRALDLQAADSEGHRRREAEKSVAEHVADLCGDVRADPTGTPLRTVTPPPAAAPEREPIAFDHAESARLDAEEEARLAREQGLEH